MKEEHTKCMFNTTIMNIKYSHILIPDQVFYFHLSQLSYNINVSSTIVWQKQNHNNKKI